MTNTWKSPTRCLSFLVVTALLLSTACDGANNSQNLQLVGGDGNFDAVILSSSGGMPWASRAGDECGSAYNNVMTVDGSSGSFTWDVCMFDSTAGHTTIGQGSRPLSEAELATVKDALAQVKIGNDGLCGADKATVTLDLQAGSALGRYVDSFYGCKPPPDGRTFVLNIDWVESALGKLLPQPSHI